jgi:hypothetical protein
MIGRSVNVPFWSAPEIVTTFVTEPPSLLQLPAGHLSGLAKKLRDLPILPDHYTGNKVFVSSMRAPVQLTDILDWA